MELHHSISQISASLVMVVETVLETILLGYNFAQRSSIYFYVIVLLAILEHDSTDTHETLFHMYIEQLMC